MEKENPTKSRSVPSHDNVEKILQIRVIQCRFLPTIGGKDLTQLTELTSFFGEHAERYAVLLLDKDKLKKSETVTRKHDVWRTLTHNFPRPNLHASKNICVQVYHPEGGRLTSDRFCGQVNFNVGDLLRRLTSKDFPYYEDYFPLEGRGKAKEVIEGELYVVFFLLNKEGEDMFESKRNAALSTPLVPLRPFIGLPKMFAQYTEALRNSASDDPQSLPISPTTSSYTPANTNRQPPEPVDHPLHASIKPTVGEHSATKNREYRLDESYATESLYVQSYQEATPRQPASMNPSENPYEKWTYEDINSPEPIISKRKFEQKPETQGELVESAGNFNERFQLAAQALQERGEQDEFDMHAIHYYANLYYVSEDFLYLARTYGKIIISERHSEHKTIQPLSVGGIAGGEKYLVSGVLFKFAIDDHGLYGGDDAAAAKVAGHELKGLTSYFNCGEDGLFFPLMAYLDYRGFRLICMSVLPINKNTLRYGSSDGGITVLNEDKGLSEKIEQISKKLNLKPHLCGRNQLVEVASAVDIEGHKGRDGRLYLLDFARVFPCEAPRATRLPGEHLYRLLRGEFVRAYPKPLCSDALSRFIANDPKRIEHNEEVKEATQYLFETAIPKCAQELVSAMQTAAQRSELLKFHIIEFIHSRGVNIRHLGLLAAALLIDSTIAQQCRTLLIIEMASRVVKDLYRLTLREKMATLRVSIQHPYIQAICKLFNLVFGNSKDSELYWDSAIKDAIVTKFGKAALKKSEYTPQGAHFKKFVLRGQLSQGVSNETMDGSVLLYLKVQQITGFKVEAKMQEALLTDANYFMERASPFEFLQVDDLGERIVTSGLVARCRGMYYLKKGLSMQGVPSVGLPLLDEAAAIFQDMLRSDPNNSFTLREYAYARSAIVFFVTEDQEFSTSKYAKDPKLPTAVEAFKRAITQNPQDYVAILLFAIILTKMGYYTTAEDYFVQSLSVNPNYPTTLYHYGSMLNKLGKQEDVVTKLFDRSKLLQKEQKEVSHA